MKTKLHIVLLSLLLTACLDDVGYVEVRSPPQFPTVSHLSIGTTSVTTSKSGRALVSVRAGTHALGGPGYFAPTYCDVVVRKDRITALTLHPAYGGFRCQCDLRASGSTPGRPTCA